MEKPNAIKVKANAPRWRRDHGWRCEMRPWPKTRHATVMETIDATMAGDATMVGEETVFGDPTMCFIVDATEGDARCYHGQRW